MGSAGASDPRPLFIGSSSPTATVEGARRSLYNPYIASSAVRPPGSPLCSDSGVSLVSSVCSVRARGCSDGEVVVGCHVERSRTPHNGLMWAAARRSTAAASLSLSRVGRRTRPWLLPRPRRRRFRYPRPPKRLALGENCAGPQRDPHRLHSWHAWLPQEQGQHSRFGHRGRHRPVAASQQPTGPGLSGSGLYNALGALVLDPLLAGVLLDTEQEPYDNESERDNEQLQPAP